MQQGRRSLEAEQCGQVDQEEYKVEGQVDGRGDAQEVYGRELEKEETKGLNAVE